ncbi:MAG: hypothetical protein IT462_02780 [Planctomycetes bacterium]|nr:hypothetical protein [Planctomycetota bacterium]
MQQIPEKPTISTCGRAGGVCAGTWLASVFLAVAGLTAAFYTRKSPSWAPFVALAISTGGMLLFLIQYSRACRLQAANIIRPPVKAPVTIAITDGDAMRRLFDRFDIRAIERARALGLSSGDASSFLNLARDFVDVAHAQRLMNTGNEAELDVHIRAAIERALLTFQAR